MVIQVVNFNLEGITHEEYMGAAKEVAPAFKELSGLRSKVWLSDEENNTYGGVYTWEDHQSMENYLNSSFYDEVLGDNPAFVNITYKAYEILEELTSITG
jgi:heme-degrading monooxygenase HmoA